MHTLLAALETIVIVVLFMSVAFCLAIVAILIEEFNLINIIFNLINIISDKIVKFLKLVKEEE